MIRWAATICFALTTLVGPGFCCCSVSSLANAQTHVSQTADKRVQGRCPHCCHSSPDTDGRASSPIPVRRECPCKNEPSRCQAAAPLPALVKASDRYLAFA